MIRLKISKDKFEKAVIRTEITTKPDKNNTISTTLRWTYLLFYLYRQKQKSLNSFIVNLIKS